MPLRATIWLGAACALVGCGLFADGAATAVDASADAWLGFDAPVDAAPGVDAAPPPTCAPSFHHEVVCAPCDASAGPCQPLCQDACVPDDEFCPFTCPSGMTCEVVAEGAGDLAAPLPWRHVGCVPIGAPLCDATTCPDGQHCEPFCHPCTAPGCTWLECESSCAFYQPCGRIGCGVERCFDDCFLDRFGDDVCLGDTLSYDTCELTLCWPGTVCGAACTTDAASCASTCATTCGADPDDACRGAITCADAPPACPPDTVPGIASGCWAGYCIPVDQCTHPCGALTTEAACRSDAQCTPQFHLVCVPVQPGAMECHIEFDRCDQVPIEVPPMEGP